MNQSPQENEKKNSPLVPTKESKDKKRIIFNRYYRKPFSFNQKLFSTIQLDFGEFTTIPLFVFKSNRFTLPQRIIRQWSKQNNLFIFSMPNLKAKFEELTLIDNKKQVCIYQYKNKRMHSDSIEIIKKDYISLHEGFYLNDKIINFYLKILEDYYSSNDKEVFILNSYKYTLISQDEKGKLDEPLLNYRPVNRKNAINIFNFKILIIPIYENNHWSLVIVNGINLMSNLFDKTLTNNWEKNKDVIFPEIFYLDSYFSNNDRCVNIIKKFLFYEFKNNYPDKIFKSSVLSFCDVVSIKGVLIKRYYPRIPKQDNLFDCGIYILVYCELFLLNKDFFINNARKFTSTQNGTQTLNDDNNPLVNWFERKFVYQKRKEIKNLLEKIGENQKNAVEDYLSQQNLKYKEILNI